MKHFFTLFIFLTAIYLTVTAQLSIDNCLEKAQGNYPLIKRYGLIEQSKEYNLSNAAKGYLPQIQINARATYQSDVVTIPISMPGIHIPTLRKDQYQAVVEVNQLIWDGGIIRSQRKITKAGYEMEIKQLEVDLYALNERVHQLFFGILLFDAQLEQNRILQDELKRNRLSVTSYVENGMANQSDLDAVKVEQLNAEQTHTQLQSLRTAYLEMLSLMTGEAIDTGIVLIKPSARETFSAFSINRPELRFFDAQNDWFDSQKDLIKSAYLPKLGLFVQGGIGRPGLNMLSDSFEPFYIGGARLSWNFGTLYTQKNDLQKIDVNKNTVNAQRELFLYNINLSVIRENQEIKRLQDLMKNDDEIIVLRENIRKSAEAKMAGGVMTVTELMREISQETLARETKAAHEIDLLMAIYKLKNVTNSK